MSGRSIQVGLLSVFDKTGIVEFARELKLLGVELLSTGGTARLLLQEGIEVEEVAEYTGFPEILEGRVKTLHPKIHGGILFRRGRREDEDSISKYGIKPIDLVAVNLYQFEETITRRGVQLDEIIEMIDIGGSALIRSAAKNYNDVAVIVDPSDYAKIIDELKAKRGSLSSQTRFKLMKKAFERTAHYDLAIAAFFDRFGKVSDVEELSDFPREISLDFVKVQDLRYGENPHQRAAVYKDPTSRICIADAKQLAGKKSLSYTNVLDADAAFALIRELKDDCATVIIKHTNPCGGAIGKTLAESYRKALATDPVSAFGGICAFSREVDEETAEAMSQQFIEVILAPGYSAEALKILSTKENRRILDITALMKAEGGNMAAMKSFRSVLGGMLYQDLDEILIEDVKLSVPTRRKPSEEEKRALIFGWKFVKHVKSNAIVLSTSTQLIGVGAGQMSRVGSCKIALQKAKEAGLEVKGVSMASDAFLPFRDSVDLAASACVSSVIQPGGSIRDDEVVRAADEHGMAMIFTGLRHFRH